MDRRSFLRSVGVTAAGTAVAASSSSAADITSSPAAGGSPQFSSPLNNNRQRILSSDLSPWAPSSGQWDVHTINHLYRRAGFGATQAEIKAASGKTPSQVVDALLDDSIPMRPTIPPLPSYSDDKSQPPAWLHVSPLVYNNSTVEMNDYSFANMKIRSHWAVQMNQPEVMLREKMTLFWMNHFVVEAKKVYFPQMMYNFLTYFRQNPWGNFKKMVSDVTTMPAMLYYLDGILNVKQAPNENYAREVQELFTMGVYYKNDVTKPNYTQADVEAVAHALSGWTVDSGAPAPNVLPAFYDVTRHDASRQMIYDTTPRQYNLKAANAPNTTEKDLFDHMFEMRGDQIAWYICSKLYQFFVYHDISGDSEKAIIDAMAVTFKNSNWEIKPVLAELLKSAHFFDEANIGAGIKSPYDHLIGLLRTFDIPIDELGGGTLFNYAVGGSQVLLDPPNVKGWPGHHAWISTTTLPYRDVIQAALAGNTGTLPTLGGVDGYSVSNTYPSILLPDILTWAKQLTNFSGVFDDFVKEMATYLCAHVPSDTVLNTVVKNGYPAGYEWASLNDAIKIPILHILLTRIMSLADFQLS